MEKFIIVTKEYMEDLYAEKDSGGFTLLFPSEEEAQKEIEGTLTEDSFILKINI